VLVAEEGSEVVGWAALGPYRERPAWAHTSEVAVYVSDAHRGKGLGTMLLSALVDEARTLGLHALVSQVVGGNDASIVMAERLGFERVGSLSEVGHKFGTWLDVVILEIVLPESDRVAEEPGDPDGPR
jgi:phosphinothricin acetyltransferase